MKQFYTIIFLSMSLFGLLAQNLDKIPKRNLKIKDNNFIKDKIFKQSANQYLQQREQHFDIYYPAYDSLEYGQTSGIYWRIHNQFKPEEYAYFSNEAGGRDSLNVKFKNAIVCFNWLNDTFNEDSTTIAYSDAKDITIDTLFYFYGHANRSGQKNSLRTRIVEINPATGQPVLSAGGTLWENVLETDTSLTAPLDNPDSVYVDLRVIPANFTLPANEPFAIVVDFSGGDRANDEFNLLATFNDPCSTAGDPRAAQRSKFFANSYYEISALVSGAGIESLFPLSDLGGLGFDFDEDGVIGEDEACEAFYIQNWHIGATVSFQTDLKANIIASKDTICRGDVLELQGFPEFGYPPYTYGWEPEEGLTQATSDFTSALPLETTTYTLIIKDSTNVEAKVNYTVFVKDLAVDLGADASVECGMPFQATPVVTNSFGGEIDFQWNHGKISSITALFPGNYELVVSDGICKAFDDINVTLSNSDLITDFTAENIYNAVVQFQSQSENVDRFSWDFGDGNTSSEENPRHSYQAGGDYQVSLNTTTGSCSSTKYLNVTVGTASHVEYHQNTKSIKIAPNPVKDIIHFSIDKSIVTKEFSLGIYNINGLLLQQHQFKKNNNVNKIEILEKTNGIYFLNIKIGSKIFTQKISVVN